ncbi:MAG: hypothetical protein IPL99_11525 [Candidatus Competibacteraceae bacterium]|nr:hypothetical protein [Candidatus Competibacteraceae bacterium]
MLMMLAFLIDQVQEYGCAFFPSCSAAFSFRTCAVDQNRKDFLPEFFIESWEALWRAIIYGHGGGALLLNTS